MRLYLYEQLIHEAIENQVDFAEYNLSPKIKGLYADDTIWINKNIDTTIEKACVLAEELGHYHTTVGDILNQSNIVNRKQELNARSWAYRKLIPLNKIITAHCAAIHNRYELADYLNVTEHFLDEALIWYRNKYGTSVSVEGYMVSFEPLGVIEFFDWLDNTSKNFYL